MILKPSYEIATADSGEAALQTLPAFNPDLVFMDIKMPQDGRHRAPPADQAVGSEHRGGDDHRLRLARHGQERADPRRLRVPDQALQPHTISRRRCAARSPAARRSWARAASSPRSSNEMRALSNKTRALEEEARREQAEQSLRVTQLSILREISRGILGQLDLAELTAAHRRAAPGGARLRRGGGLTSARAARRRAVGGRRSSAPSATMPADVGYLVAANRTAPVPSTRASASCSRCSSEYSGRRDSQLPSVRRSGGDQAVTRAAGAARRATPSSPSTPRLDQGWNPAAERIFGWSAREAVGRSLRGMFPEEPVRAGRAAGPHRHAAGQLLRSERQAGRREDAEPRRDALRRARARRPSRRSARHRPRHDRRSASSRRRCTSRRSSPRSVRWRAASPTTSTTCSRPSSATRSSWARTPEHRRRAPRPVVIEKAAMGGAETVRRIQKFARLRPEEPFVVRGAQPGHPRLRGHHPAALGREAWPRAAFPFASTSELDSPAHGHGPAVGAQRGHHQSHPQCHRCHAARGHPRHLHAPRGRRARGAHRRGHRRGHARARAQAHLRSLLHHQGRSGHRSGVVGVLFDHPASRRRDARGEPARARHDLHHRASRGHGGEASAARGQRGPGHAPRTHPPRGQRARPS